MKLKISIIFFFVTFAAIAQKQIQPYKYSSQNGDKTEILLIYASAEAINSITFTLKDTKENVLKDEGGKEIIFKVFPFTEVAFRSHFIDAFQSVNSETKKSQFKTITQTLDTIDNDKKDWKKANLEVRNIYQFFNALVITAFQYDTEPVAGALKYKDSTTIIKKNIEGLDTDQFFNRQGKLIRKLIIEADGKKENFKIKLASGKYSSIIDDGFLKFLSKNFLPNEVNKKEDLTQENNDSAVEENSFLMKFFEFHQNTKKGKNRNARVKLKAYIKKRLKQLYNTYQLSNFTETELIRSYFKFKSQIVDSETELNSLKEKKLKNRTETKRLEAEIDTVKQEIQLLQDFSELFIWEGDSDLLPINQEKVDNAKSQYDKKITNLEKTISDHTLLIENFSKKNVDIDNRIQKINDSIKEIQNKINFSIARNKQQIVNVPIWNFVAENIEIDFNDGFIEHITVTGTVGTPSIDEISILNSLDEASQKKYYNSNLKSFLKSFFEEGYTKEILKDISNEEYKFENEYPIGFSSKTDFADLDTYDLFAFEGSEKLFSLPLTNVIYLYVQRHQNDRLDFSPKNQVVRLPLEDIDQNNVIELKKEKSSKILNAKIYTDFNGLKEREPNGLVQIEVEKEVPLWTKRMPLGLGRSSNIGFANYAKFNLTWAKLNDEDRQIQASYAENFVNNELNVDKYVTYLDLIRYENVSVGVDLNVASLDFPLIKTRLEINAGAHYGRLKVVDTLTNSNGTPRTSLFDKDVNMIRLYPDVILRIRPEERFGGYLRFRPFKTIVPNNEEFFSVSSEKSFQENRDVKEDWLNRYELGLFYTPSADSDNKFFFRYRYTNTFDWETNGYSELQLGYLVYLKF